MIKDIIKNLKKGKELLKKISQEDYRNKSVEPYNSSIGENIRHILDIFKCIVDGIDDKMVFLSKRDRNEFIELDIDAGLFYFDEIIKGIESIDKFNEIILVIDDLGSGEMSHDQTISGLLKYAHSHALHHFASLGYITHQLGIELPDNDFGYNPTTPRK